MATGVLPLVIGKATRLSQFFLHSAKIYEAVFEFGHSTNTYDREGEPTSEHVSVTLVREQLDRNLDVFRGRFQQVPPAVSAKKIRGTPAYKLARRNAEVKLNSVEVEVFSLDLTAVDENIAHLTIHCAGGTYVRSIAHDLGQQMGCGAFLRDLRRSASSGFDLSMAKTMDELAELAAAGDLSKVLIPAPELLPEFPTERVDTSTANFIRQGRDFRVSPFRIQQFARYVKAVGPDGVLVAIGEAKLPQLYHPILVL